MAREQSWESLSEAERVEAVKQGQATLEQMRQGVLEGPDLLRQACWQALAHRPRTGEEIPAAPSNPHQNPKTEPVRNALGKKPRRSDRAGQVLPKQRFGLPRGFVHRQRREQGNILLANNIYRLPNGIEVVPCQPTGTLGRQHHLYALLTVEQYKKGARGSTYLRTDGRVFDYSVDDVGSGRELFDTGYTVADLERTGDYVSKGVEFRD